MFELQPGLGFQFNLFISAKVIYTYWIYLPYQSEIQTTWQASSER